MIPTIGQFVAYTLSQGDVDQIRANRGTSGNSLRGNAPAAGEVYPMLITRTWGPPSERTAVNGQVVLDGNDTLWVTSRIQHLDEGPCPEFKFVGLNRSLRDIHGTPVEA